MEHLGLLSATSRLVVALKKLSKAMRRDRLRTGTRAGTGAGTRAGTGAGTFSKSHVMGLVWCGVWWAVLCLISRWAGVVYSKSRVGGLVVQGNTSTWTTGHYFFFLRKF